MILKASERGNAAELARHLMNARDNDHVELHELRGFACDDLAGAMLEADAVAKGIHCRNLLFSLSLNPPENETVPVEVFEATVETVEQRLGLDRHPRAIVFHEKEGRRHAHAVWSRIDAETMTAKNLACYKTRLMEVSRELYLEHGWRMPRGMIDRSLRNPLNFSRAEWQQAKRAQTDPRLIKAAFQDAWNRSDNADALRVAEPFQKVPEALHDRSLRGLRQGGELRGVDLRREIGKHRGDGVDAAHGLRIAQQIERRERWREYPHRAGIGLVGLDSPLHRRHVLAVVEDDAAPSGPDIRQALGRDDLELHDGLVRRAMQLRRLQQPDIVGLPLVAHQRVDVPGRRRRAP